MYNILRVDSDPTSWELCRPGVEELPTFSDPEVLQVYHPLLGELVLSSQSVGSAVFLEYQLPLRYGTRPNGMPMSNGALYLPSPIGPDILMNPPNIYNLGGSVDLAVLKADIIAAMTGGTFLTVKATQGEVVINGAKVPFVVLCPPNP